PATWSSSTSRPPSRAPAPATSASSRRSNPTAPSAPSRATPTGRTGSCATPAGAPRSSASAARRRRPRPATGWRWASRGCAADAGPDRSGGEQRLDELLGVEVDQVGGRLADAHQLDRDAELLLDGEDNPALGRAVELGQDHAGHVDGLPELLGLVEPVLAGRGVDDQQDLLEGAGRPVDDAAQ